MRSVGYDSPARILEIEFQSGVIYRYLNVPLAIHEELLAAESKGQYFNREIRDTYQFVRASQDIRGATA